MVFLLAILFGLVVGSFLNVFIDRIPRGENVIWKPSHCDFCKKPLRWFELFPIVSFLAQGGKCRRCKKRLSIQYPLIEFVTACGFVLLLPSAAVTPIGYVLALIIFSVAVVIFVIDLKHQIIPDGALLVLAGALILSAIPLSFMERWNHILTACVSGLGFFLLWIITRGRGLGFGDVKLVFLIGLLLGYPLTVVALYIAFLTGATTGVILIVANRAKMKTRIAFGPFLIAGALCATVLGERIFVWFYSLI